MKTFIKSGFWTTKKSGATPKGWLDLTKLIKDNSGGGTSNYIPLTGTEEGKPVTGMIRYFSDVDAIIESGSDGVISHLTSVTSSAASGHPEGLIGYSQVSFFGAEIGHFGINNEEEIYLRISNDGAILYDRFHRKGLKGEEDYSANLTPLHYVQRSYVEKPETLINCLNNATPEQLSTIKSILGISQT